MDEHECRTLLASPYVRLPWRRGAWDRLMLQWRAPDRTDWGLIRHRIVRERNLRLGPLALTWWRLATPDENLGGPSDG